MDGSSADRLSVAELEQKKVSLPYIEQIEYINEQLRMRGIFVARSDRRPSPVEPAVLVEQKEIVMTPDKRTETPPTFLDSMRPIKHKRKRKVELEKLRLRRKKENPYLKTDQIRQDKKAPVRRKRDLSCLISPQTLVAKYPRFCQNLSTIQSLEPKRRSLTWLLRLLEEVFDEAYQHLIAPMDRHKPPVGFVMPFFVHSFITNSLGLKTIAEKECIDLLYTIESCLEDFPQVKLMSFFLRELYDQDTILYYLHVRHVMQQEFGFQFKLKQKLLHGTRLFHQDGAVIVHNDPRLSDGTQQVFLSDFSCTSIVKMLLKSGKLAHYLIHEYFKMEFQNKMIPAIDFLLLMLHLFRDISSDIVAKFKYNDDGEMLNTLGRLQETLGDDQEIVSLKDTAILQERDLQDAQIYLVKIQRRTTLDPTSTQLRTKLVLTKNDVVRKQQELDDTRRKIELTEDKVNSIWSNIMRNKRKSKRPRQENRTSLAVTNVLRRLHCYVKDLSHKRDVEKKAAELMKRSWKGSLEELEERTVIKIQRIYRARLKYRREKAEADEEIARRRVEKEKEIAEKKIQKKRLESLRLRDAEKHRSRMKEKQGRQDKVKEAAKKRNAKLLAQHGEAEAHRRLEKHQTKLMERMFQRWCRFLKVMRQNRMAQSKSTAGRFRRWKGYIELITYDKKAATKIQAAFRGMRGRRYVKHIRQEKMALAKRIERIAGRIRNRCVWQTFFSWCDFTYQQQRIRQMFSDNTSRSIQATFSQWVRLVELNRLDRYWAAVDIQRIARGYNDRKRYRLQKERIAAALTIQRVYRGFQARETVAMRRALNHKLDGLGRRMMNRKVFRCYAAWATFTVIQIQVRAMMSVSARKGLEDRFNRWNMFRYMQQQEREERLRLENHAATRIQCSFRTYRCKQYFRRILIENRAAIVMQRAARCYLARKFAKYLKLKMEMARRVQRIWRGQLGRRIANNRRIELMLEAAASNDFIRMNYYFETGVAYGVDINGITCLHKACESGSKKMIKLCLRNGIDPTVYDSSGVTPLHIIVSCIYESRAELAEYLIDHGAWHEAVDCEGNTPLLTAAKFGHTDCVAMLLKRQANDCVMDNESLSPLQIAVAYGYTETVEAILSSTHNLDFIDPNDGTKPIHECAAQGYLEMFEILKKYGAGLDDQDFEGNTPMHYAVTNNQVEIVKALIQADIVPNTCNNIGRSPLHLAVLEGLYDIALLLAETDVAVDVQDAEGDTALHLGSSTRYTECCKLVMSFGGNIEVRNHLGNQPLHLAAASGNEELVRELLKYQADVNFKNYEGATAVGMARMAGYGNIVKLIQDSCLQEEIQLENQSSVEWDTNNAIKMSKLGDWEDYIDKTTGQVHYYNSLTDTWTGEDPVEYTAALGTEWNRVFDPEMDRYRYQSRKTQEFIDTPPALNVARLQDAIQGQHRRVELRLRAQDHGNYATTGEYKTFWENFDEETRQAKLEVQSCMIIQRNYRRHLAERELRKRREERDAAILLQRHFRIRLAKREIIKIKARCRAAISIQSVVRGFLTRRYETQIRWYREDLKLKYQHAITVQKHFRGAQGRKYARQYRAQWKGPESFFEWEKVRKRGQICNTFNLWEERIFPESLDAVFYSHQITGQCQWEKPQEWVESDYLAFLDRQTLYYYGYTVEMQRSASKLQALWRARDARRHFSIIIKSIQIMKNCEIDYLRRPDNLTALCNYMVYLHTMKHEYERTRPLYGKALELMTHRGPDIAFVLFNYAIYLYVTREDDLESILHLISRATAVDPHKSCFKLVHLGFYRQSMILNPHNSQANLNYAVCQQLVYNDYDTAREYYLRAVNADPHDSRTMDAFNEMLDYRKEKRDGFDLFLEWQSKQAEEDDLQRQEKEAKEAEAKKLNDSATKIQNIYRQRKGRQQTKRLDALNLSVALKLRDESNKNDYEVIQAAFAQVSGNFISQNELFSVLNYLQVFLHEKRRNVDEIMMEATQQLFRTEKSLVTYQEFFIWWIKADHLAEYEELPDETGYKHRETGAIIREAIRFRFDLTKRPEGWIKMETQRLKEYLKDQDTIPVDEIETISTAFGRNISKHEQEEIQLRFQVLGHPEKINAAEFLNYWFTRVFPPEGEEDPEDWEECYDTEGTAFYYNVNTSASEWERPAFRVYGWGSLFTCLSKENQISCAFDRFLLPKSENLMRKTELPALFKLLKSSITKSIDIKEIGNQLDQNDNGTIEKQVFLTYWLDGRIEPVDQLVEALEQLNHESSEWERHFDDSTGQTYYYNPKTMESKWNEWETIENEDKSVYYYNILTGSSQWENPEWESIDDGQGNVYYYNANTGESRWDRPF